MPKLRAPKQVEKKVKEGKLSPDLPTPSPFGMVSLPDGLNPIALMELLKRIGVNTADEAATGLMPAAKALPGSVSDMRFQELMKLFGGQGKP